MRSAVRRLGASTPRPIDFETDFDGKRYRGRLDQMIDREIFFFGSYAPAELHFLDHCASALRRCRETICFVDVGANVGQHSLFMSGRADQVFSFEPQDGPAGQLRDNLAVNGVGNVRVIGCALGDRDGEARLGSGFDGNNGSRSICWTLDTASDTPIEVRHADAMLDRLGAPRIDILKLDVEGYEKTVFRGLKERMRSDRPIVLFELIGEAEKGGFTSREDLELHLYENHVLLGLEGLVSHRLTPFEWTRHDAAVCLPREVSEHLAR